jgi:hypothetical protein
MFSHIRDDYDEPEEVELASPSLHRLLIFRLLRVRVPSKFLYTTQKVILLTLAMACNIFEEFSWTYQGLTSRCQKHGTCKFKIKFVCVNFYFSCLIMATITMEVGTEVLIRLNSRPSAVVMFALITCYLSSLSSKNPVGHREKRISSSTKHFDQILNYYLSPVSWMIHQCCWK